MRLKLALTSDDAQQLVLACKDEATRNGWDVTIAIVDDAGYLFHLDRMDGAKLTTIDVAIGKARTAAFSRAPTKAMEDRLPGRLALLKLQAMPMQGGMPILHAGVCVGGIGVSGVESQQDEQIAQAGLRALPVPAITPDPPAR